MSPAERLKRAREKAERATLDLENQALAFSRVGGSGRDDLLAAAKRATNAWHEVGRCEKAVRDA